MLLEFNSSLTFSALKSTPFEIASTEGRAHTSGITPLPFSLDSCQLPAETLVGENELAYSAMLRPE